MITKEQINELSEFFQIDEFTVAREYLQLLFLSYLYQERDADKICFKGGTAIRSLFGSPRFSEDLDFSTTFKAKEIADLIKKLETKIQKELPGIKIVLVYSGRNGIRFRMEYNSSDFKYPLIVRLDFNRVEKIDKKETSALATRFPLTIFPLVCHLQKEKILAEKIHALVSRKKGRDLFDVWFLLSKGVYFDKAEDRNIVIKKIKSFSQDLINKDLAKFLPSSQRKIIGVLKDELIKKIRSS